jgi:Protein of unknown function (DUF3309)
MLGTILTVVLILALLGALPRWSHSRDWGYAPTGEWGWSSSSSSSFWFSGAFEPYTPPTSAGALARNWRLPFLFPLFSLLITSRCRALIATNPRIQEWRATGRRASVTAASSRAPSSEKAGVGPFQRN